MNYNKTKLIIQDLTPLLALSGCGPDTYPRAIRETLGSTIIDRRKRYLNNRLERDQRGIKQHC